MNKCLNVICVLLGLLLFSCCGGKETQSNDGQGSCSHASLAVILLNQK